MNKFIGQRNDMILTFFQVLEIDSNREKRDPAFFTRVLTQVRLQVLLAIIDASEKAGNPTGVVLPHCSFGANITSAAQVVPLGPTDTLSSICPLCHSFEWMAG